jgi:hypothetical protein
MKEFQVDRQINQTKINNPKKNSLDKLKNNFNNLKLNSNNKRT